MRYETDEEIIARWKQAVIDVALAMGMAYSVVVQDFIDALRFFSSDDRFADAFGIDTAEFASRRYANIQRRILDRGGRRRKHNGRLAKMERN